MFHGGGHGGGGHGGGGHGGGGFRGGRGGLLLGGGVWGPWGVYDCLDAWDDPFCTPAYPALRGYPLVIGSEAADDLFDDTMLGSGGIGRGMMG